MKKQIIIIHGGETFRNYKEYFLFLKNYKIDFAKSYKGWKSTLPEKLGRQYEIFQPQMPSPLNAKYTEWKLWFEKYKPIMNKEIILVGHSLGGIFLTKYLSENKLKKKIKGLFLVAAPFDDKDSSYSLGDFKLKKDLSLVIEQCEQVVFYHSKDDFCAPFADLNKYQKAMPGAIYRTYLNRTHFIGSTFPEIIRDIKKL
jgi:predicted alpha/beta hydrolase family esterase